MSSNIDPATILAQPQSGQEYPVRIGSSFLGDNTLSPYSLVQCKQQFFSPLLLLLLSFSNLVHFISFHDNLFACLVFNDKSQQPVGNETLDSFVPRSVDFPRTQASFTQSPRNKMAKLSFHNQAVNTTFQERRRILLKRTLRLHIDDCPVIICIFNIFFHSFFLL